MSGKKRPSYAGNVRLKAKENAASATLTIGDVIIPFYKAVVVVEPGQLTRIEVLVPTEHVDVEALQLDTSVHLVPPQKADEPPAA